MTPRVHHSAVCVRDVDTSLRFWRDGMGLTVLMDMEFDGDWQTLFDAPSARLRSVFLGDPSTPDAGIVELVQFQSTDGADDDVGRLPLPPDSDGSGSRPRDDVVGRGGGFLLLSFFVDVEEALARLRAAGFAGEDDVRRIEVPSPNGPVQMATLRDPDGVMVELVGVAR